MDKQQGPTYSTENYIQYPLINHNRKGYFKKTVHITELLYWRAKIQHYKSTILQFLKRDNNCTKDMYRSYIHKIKNKKPPKAYKCVSI